MEYVCSRRTLQGTCEKSGVQFNVYTRNRTDNFNPNEYSIDDVTELIRDLAQAVCLNPNDLQLETGEIVIAVFLRSEKSRLYISEVKLKNKGHGAKFRSVFITQAFSMYSYNSTLPNAQHFIKRWVCMRHFHTSYGLCDDVLNCDSCSACDCVFTKYRNKLVLASILSDLLTRFIIILKLLL